MLSLKGKFFNVEYHHQQLIIENLRLKGNLNIRGALEWVREQISKHNFGNYDFLSLSIPSEARPLTITDDKPRQPKISAYSLVADHYLLRLIKHQEFSTYLRRICDVNHKAEQNMKTSIAELYYTVSRKAYRYSHHFDVIVISDDYPENEVLALGYIFTIYNIRYCYTSKNSRFPTYRFPFKL